MKYIFTLLLSVTLIFSKAQMAGSFSLHVNGTPPTGFVQALTIAAQKWSNFLQITVPIKVNVFTVNSSLLPFSAITLANGRKNFANAPVPNTLYSSALANQLASAETNVGEYDMDIYFNLSSSYYYGSGLPPSSQTDFISTAMHEMGHGLGFYSDGYVDNNGKGSFGNIPQSAIFLLPTSFPWRGKDSVPTIFDKFIVKSSNNHLTTCAPPYSIALGDSIKNGAVYFNGPLYANASHSNSPIRLSGGTGSYTLGVDLLHIHNTYANTIMSYYWGAGDTVRTPAPWELGILKEIGWNLKVVGIRENTNELSAIIYPNPSNANVFIRALNFSELNLYNIEGENIKTVINATKEEELIINTSKLAEGIYFLKISFYNSQQPEFKKIIIRH